MAEWRKRPSLLHPRKAHDGAIVNGHIVVVTGATDDTEPPVFTVEAEARRTAGRGEWRSLPPLITVRGNAAVAAVNGSVYVAGGTVPKGGNNEENTASVVVFDPEKPKSGWQEVAPMLRTRARHKLVASGSYLYAIGGENEAFDARSSAERYDPLSNTWTRIAPMRESRAFFGIAVVGRDIAVVGGYTAVGPDSTFLRTTEIYDLSDDRWRTLDTLLPQRRVSLFAATESNGSLLAIGGVVSDDEGKEPPQARLSSNGTSIQALDE